MKKRFLSLLIVLLAVLQFMSPAHAAEAPANIKKYNTVTEYTYTTGA